MVFEIVPVKIDATCRLAMRGGHLSGILW